MIRKKNGFINLLFDDSESSLPFNFTKDHDCKLQQLNSIKKLTEEYMIQPKNRLKYIKIVKMNDFVRITPDKKSTGKYRDKFYVDGCQLTKIIPIRQLATHNQARTKQVERSYSPQAHTMRQQQLNQYMNRSQFCYRENSYLQSMDLQNPQVEQGKIQQPQPLNLLMKNVQNKAELCDFTVQNSTTSSSNRDFKPKTVRYRKVSNFQKKQAVSVKKNLIETKKQLFKHYTNPPLIPENITAKAYIVFEHFKQTNNKKSEKYLHIALNSKINLQVASLTKIMTCILTLQICETNNINISNQLLKIGEFETNVEGTKAQIQSGEIYSVQQLLYGLMLPSGNDASIALSVFCGEILQNSRGQQKKTQIPKDIKLKKYYYKKFIFEMNKKCMELQMKRTFFSNSHGLANNLNRSCAFDMATLIDYALRNPLFRNIVGTKIYQCSVFDSRNQNLERSQRQRKMQNKQRKVKWQNTHKFLHTKAQFYKGIKTGTTQVAGPCLASLISINNRQFIIIVLNSKSLKARYKDTEMLREWLFKKEQLSNDFNNQ